MNELLFSPVTQWDGATTTGETTFQFLERGGRHEAVAIRQWMEDWFRVFPLDHRNELKLRLQSKDFGKFMGAYFELQVFAMLHRLNCHVVIHPRFSETDGTVDFRVTHGQDVFYVEATVCGIGQGVLRSNANEEDAVRKIRETLINPHSDVWLYTTGELGKTLRKQRLVKPINELVESSNPDEVRRLQGESRWRRPGISINQGDWRMDVYLSPPVASDGRGQIWGPGRVGPVDGSSPLEKALSKKAKDWRQKKLEQEMFLIAVNACHADYTWGDERNAIYGHPDPIVDQEAFAKSLSCVAGVIVFGNATLGRERVAPLQMYRNQDSRIPECLQFLSQEKCLGKVLCIG